MEEEARLRSYNPCISRDHDDIPTLQLKNEIQFTSECIVKRVYNMAKTIHNVFTSCGLHYWTSGGTTLGCIRHQGLIPWDDDLDVCIYEEDTETLLGVAKIALAKEGYEIGESDLYGYKIFHSTDSETVLPAASTVDHHHRYPFCDVFVMKCFGTDNKCFIANERGRAYWPTEFYYTEDAKNTVQKPFGNIMLNCPRNAEEYLERMYGKNWQAEAITPNRDHLTKVFIKKSKFVLTEELRQPAKPFY